MRLNAVLLAGHLWNSNRLRVGVDKWPGLGVVWPGSEVETVNVAAGVPKLPRTSSNKCVAVK